MATTVGLREPRRLKLEWIEVKGDEPYYKTAANEGIQKAEVMAKVGGFFVAAGFCAHGIAGAGGVGRAMAAWILDGDPGRALRHTDVRRFERQQGALARLTLSPKRVKQQRFATEGIIAISGESSPIAPFFQDRKGLRCEIETCFARDQLRVLDICPRPHIGKLAFPVDGVFIR